MLDDPQFVELKNVLRGILSASSQTGMTLRNLEQLYNKQECKVIPLFGHSNVLQLIKSMPDTVCTRIRNGHLVLFPVEDVITHNAADGLAKSRPKGSRIHPARMIDFGLSEANQPKLQNPVPNPPMHQFYEDVCPNIRLPPSNEFGFDILDLPQTNPFASQQLNDLKPPMNISSQNAYDKYDFWCQPIASNRDPIVTDAVQTEHDSNAEFSCEASASDGISKDDINELIDLNIDFALLAFNDSCIQFDPLPTLDFAATFQIGQRLRIRCSEVFSPYKFWFQRDEDDVEMLMSALDSYYNKNDDIDETKVSNTPMPEEHMKVGRVCAAMYQSLWHRGRIIDVLDQSVKVFYVDYGTVAEVKKTDIRFLHKQFAAQPIYAHRGCLEKCRPYFGIWYFEGLEMFQNRTIDFFTVPPMGQVTHLNPNEKTVYFNMFDTSGAADICMAKWLIENNLAQPTKKLLFDFESRHHTEVYPSFEKIENGKYPSFNDLKQMKQNGFDYLVHETRVCIPEMYGYVTKE